MPTAHWALAEIVILQFLRVTLLALIDTVLVKLRPVTEDEILLELAGVVTVLPMPVVAADMSV